MQSLNTKYINRDLAIMAEKFLLNSGLDLSVFNNLTVFPGFCDVHVHFREPGFSYKETIKSGSIAAAHGGYTSVCTMPNLSPVPDSYKNLKVQIDMINKDAKINIFPYGSITRGEMGESLSDMEDLSKYVIAFSDDGKGVQSSEIMEQAMINANKLGKIIAAHCEDNALLFGGYIHDGNYAKVHNHKGICSESEWKQIERDIALAKKTGCKYHICHISCKESVEIIRKAKHEGIDVSCETAPHYLVLDEGDLMEDGRFKMNPPLRLDSDRMALIEGIKDGTIDMIATDHAPHSAEEKAGGLKDSLFGIVGLETAFSVLYTNLVKKDKISLERLVELLSTNPKRRFEIKDKNSFSIWDLSYKSKIDSTDFFSKGKSTPFENETVYGRCILTVSNGKPIYVIGG
ncbi:MAG: dihydroorotase [Firmicutes bacterium]|nr:dihydroorotase [Bacillota bacterium]